MFVFRIKKNLTADWFLKEDSPSLGYIASHKRQQAQKYWLVELKRWLNIDAN